MLRVSAILTALLEKHRIKPIIVGGLAVEIYTRSEYTTADIDLILSRRDLANELLIELGFTKEGRHWYHEELLISIEIPGDMLQDADYERIIELQLPESRKVFVIGIEDIILDRLRACIHCKSTADCE
jgi:predicted nucleotidyltransferase